MVAALKPLQNGDAFFKYNGDSHLFVCVAERSCLLRCRKFVGGEAGALMNLIEVEQ